MSSSSNLITQIPNKPTHDTLVAQSTTNPTIIYVSNSSTPVCKAFTPQYETLAEKWSGEGVRFCQMEFATETAALFKFSPNQLPVLVLMCTDAEGKNWCRTLMRPGVGELEGAVEEMIGRWKG